MELIKDIVIKLISDIICDEKIEEVLSKDEDLSKIGINSVGFIRLIVSIELEFDIEFQDEELNYSKFNNLTALCDYIELCVSEQRGA